MLNITYADVKAVLDEAGPPSASPPYRRPPSKCEFVLTVHDCAWNPASTKHLIHGPARVTYERFVDGGVKAEVGPIP